MLSTVTDKITLDLFRDRINTLRDIILERGFIYTEQYYTEMMGGTITGVYNLFHCSNCDVRFTVGVRSDDVLLDCLEEYFERAVEEAYSKLEDKDV